MNSAYKVLLIDDQFESDAIQNFVLNASYSDIEVHCVGFHKEGIELLKNDFNHTFQAVILDATGFISKDDMIAGKDLSNAGLTHSLMFLKESRQERVIPWFIYSGAPRNIDNDEFIENIKVYQQDIKFGRPENVFYIKTNMDDEEALLEDIKSEIDKLSDTKIVNQFSPVFRAIEGIPALEKHRNSLIDILENLDIAVNFNQIRMVLESLFKSLSDANIIPDSFTEQKGWITGTSLFLAGKHSDYEVLDPEFIHPTICETLYRVLNIVQDASHNEGSLRLKVEEYRRHNTYGYLNQSVVFGLLEIVCYFGNLLKYNQDKEKNRSRWKLKTQVINEEDYIESIFLTISEAGWGIIKCIDGKEVDVHPKAIEKYDLAVGENLRVILEFKEEKNKFHIKDIQKRN